MAGLVKTIAGGGECSSAVVVDGVGTSACFVYPVGVFADSAGSIFVADTGHHSIRKIATSGDECCVLCLVCCGIWQAHDATVCL